LCSCERGPTSQTGFFKEGFSVLGRSFPFPNLLGFFPSFCQALAEDRVTTPTKKKKYEDSGGVGMTNTINRAELAGIAAALINKYTKIAADSACSLSQIR